MLLGQGKKKGRKYKDLFDCIKKAFDSEDQPLKNYAGITKHLAKKVFYQSLAFVAVGLELKPNILPLKKEWIQKWTSLGLKYKVILFCICYALALYIPYRQETISQRIRVNLGEGQREKHGTLQDNKVPGILLKALRDLVLIGVVGSWIGYSKSAKQSAEFIIYP